MWKGAVTFGLVSIPVKLYVATEEHGVSLHQVHAADGGRIRMKRTCEKCGEQVASSDIAKGYEDDEGRSAVLTDSDMARLPVPSKKVIDVLAFVDADDIDPLRLDNSYYLATETDTAAKPYVLLREALSTQGKVAVVKITLRTRESLALLRVHDDMLVLHTMYWPDEVRPAAGLAPSGKSTVRSQELKMAASLMDTLSADFDLDALHDEYQEALDTLVTAKLGREPVPGTDRAAEAPGNVIDLMSALRASIEVRAEGRGRGAEAGTGTAGGAGGEERPAKPARKTAAGKTAAGKRTSAAKKAG